METAERSRVAREEWAKRVERWCESGLTAAEFAAELGINARTLTYWKWVLGRKHGARNGPGRRAKRDGEKPRRRSRRAGPRRRSWRSVRWRPTSASSSSSAVGGCEFQRASTRK